MEIIKLKTTDECFKKQVAGLLSESFHNSYGDCAQEEVAKCLEDERIALIALEENNVVGFVGAIPQYGITGWELHPLVVKGDKQFQGIGTALIEALEKEVAKEGGLTIYLGSDDEDSQTSLSNMDLYKDTYKQIENIKNKKRHPFEFYQKVGYKIVGVIPDANGIGKPDIWMAKAVGNR